MANLLDKIFGPDTDEFTGLLSPEETGRARQRSLFDAGVAMLGAAPGQTFGQRLAGGIQSGRAAYTGAIKQQLAGEEILAQRQQQAKRAEIARRFASQPGETPEQTDNRLRRMLGELVAAGLTEDAGKISEYLKSRGYDNNAAKDKLDTINTGTEIIDRRYNPATGKWEEIGRNALSARPVDPMVQAARHDASQQRIFTRAQQLYGDFQADTKNEHQRAESWRTISTTGPSARQGDAASQIALVFAFMKMLDPGSVVRESEYATAKNAAGVPERVRNQYNKILDGQFLSAEQVERFVEEARRQGKASHNSLQHVIRRYGQRAAAWGIDDPSLVTTDWYEGIELDAPKAPAPAGNGDVVRDALRGSR